MLTYVLIRVQTMSPAMLVIMIVMMMMILMMIMMMILKGIIKCSAGLMEIDFGRMHECGTTGSFRILQNRLRHTGGVNGRRIRAPKIFRGHEKEECNLVMTSKHKKVNIEWSSGFMKIDVGPMGQGS